MLTSLPNLLTLSRILVIAPLIALFWVEGDSARWVAFGLYVYACLTDFFDGYAARQLGSVSRWGRFLDPIADKLLVGALLLVMCAFERIAGLAVLPAIIILMREILVSGLREFLAEIKVGLPVSRLAKWKTAIQMLALGFLIVGDAAPAILPATAVGEIGLWAAALLTLVTGYDYLRAGSRHMRETGASEAPARPKRAPMSNRAPG